QRPTLPGRYRRIVSGAKTAVSTAQASTQPAAPAAPVPDVRPHTAVVRWITGLTSTKARSQPDMICGPTKMLPAKVSAALPRSANAASTGRLRGALGQFGAQQRGAVVCRIDSPGHAAWPYPGPATWR